MHTSWDVGLNFDKFVCVTPGLPWCGSDGKESACNARDLGSIPGSERSPGEGNGQPTPVFLPGEFRGHRNLVGSITNPLGSPPWLRMYSLSLSPGSWFPHGPLVFTDCLPAHSAWWLHIPAELLLLVPVTLQTLCLTLCWSRVSSARASEPCYTMSWLGPSPSASLVLGIKSAFFLVAASALSLGCPMDALSLPPPVCFVSMPLSLASRPPDWCCSDSHLSFQIVLCLEPHQPPRWAPPNLNHICRNHLSPCHAAPPPAYSYLLNYIQALAPSVVFAHQRIPDWYSAPLPTEKTCFDFCYPVPHDDNHSLQFLCLSWVISRAPNGLFCWFCHQIFQYGLSALLHFVSSIHPWVPAQLLD